MQAGTLVGCLVGTVFDQADTQIGILRAACVTTRLGTCNGKDQYERVLSQI